MRYLMLAAIGTLFAVLPVQEEPTAPSVSVIRVDGAISPVTTNYITRGLKLAREANAECLVIELDTPGGLLESTKNIVQLFFESDIPIVVYVTPPGARAASAGTFITMAAHIAAMSPTTTIGAASPVQMSPGGGGQTDTVMQKKIFNYTESFIKSIADRRGRNAEWAISAVREGESVTAKEALELNVIDLLAKDRKELLSAIDGRVVDGDTLQTGQASIQEIPENMSERFLGFILRPEVMLILTLIAIYGIIGEISNPGAIVPGTAGVIALILLLYASAAMPINIAGFALIGLAIILFIAEAFTPTFGLLIAGGAVAFFLGALMLFQDLPEPMELSLAWLIPATILTALFFVWIVSAGLKAQFSPHHTGLSTMIGKKAEVVDKVDETGGRVFINGEYWNARSSQVLKRGEQAEVVDVHGLTMEVKPLSPDKLG
ncbi:MAG: nodulation protein NfeD [Balneolaceae bacterium]|nr:nodulation protein NfeD [Balneolaceae bacterium]